LKAGSQEETPRSGKIPIRIPFLADEKVDLKRLESEGKLFEYGDQLIRFRPSYHDYPYEELIHSHRRRTCMLFIIAGMVFPCAVVFLIYYVKRLCQRSRLTHGPILISQLTDEDERIIKHCAERLRRSSKGTDREPMLKVRQNPLDEFLEYNDSVSTDHLMPKESALRRDIV
uniref:Anoctamin n=1 Tax=Soboliphyme baturini TaxID=241478 RepID=A0A183IV56_9BILA